jgi:hypothetical protein
MTTNTFLYFTGISLLLSSCTSSPFEVIVAENISIDTVAYSYVNIDRFISVETDTTKINIRFPLLQGAPLKDSVQKAILDGVVGSDSLSKSLEDYANNFIADYQSYLKDEFSNHFPWEMDIDISVATNTANHFCIVANEYEYMGGAHPNGYVIYSNFDRATGSIVGLGSIFENGTKEKLTVIAEKLFREQQQVDDSLSLADAGFFTLVEEGEEGRFFLNQNFLIEKDGIRFYYNKYEIAPYVVGPSEVFIPWQKILHLLNKNFNP